MLVSIGMDTARRSIHIHRTWMPIARFQKIHNRIKTYPINLLTLAFRNASIKPLTKHKGHAPQNTHDKP